MLLRKCLAFGRLSEKKVDAIFPLTETVLTDLVHVRCRAKDIYQKASAAPALITAKDVDH
jgi:hypothetical protein